jgi:hypothetical protein
LQNTWNVKVQLPIFWDWSPAEHEIELIPTGNTEPRGGWHVTEELTSPSTLSQATGGEYQATVEGAPKESKDWDGTQRHSVGGIVSLDTETAVDFTDTFSWLLLATLRETDSASAKLAMPAELLRVSTTPAEAGSSKWCKRTPQKKHIVSQDLIKSQQ